MRRSKQCQIEMVMCCNTVPAPCASVSNQHACVKFPCPPVRHWKTLRIQPKPLLGLSLSLSLSHPLSFLHVAALFVATHVRVRNRFVCLLQSFDSRHTMFYNKKGSEKIDKLFMATTDELEETLSGPKPVLQIRTTLLYLFSNCKNRLWFSFSLSYLLILL